MKTISSTSKTLFFLIFLLLQTSNTSSTKLLSKDLLHFFGDFLEPEVEQKMKETSKQWSSVKIYENTFPNESEVAVFRNVNTEEIFLVGETMPNQKLLVSHLRQNDFAKWNGVFVWFAGNWFELMRNKSKYKLFLKTLMLAIAENVSVTLTTRNGESPLMIVSVFDDKNSILALIKRGANVNQQNNFGETALHSAADYGSIDVCAILLDNDANIDAVNHNGWTPLMHAANVNFYCTINREKNMYEFLIEKGADETPINNDGKTAAQLANFQQR